VDVLLGGGQKFFDPKKRKDKRDLKPDYRAAGYAVLFAVLCLLVLRSSIPRTVKKIRRGRRPEHVEDGVYGKDRSSMNRSRS
jgi:hypothetical protein